MIRNLFVLIILSIGLNSCGGAKSSLSVGLPSTQVFLIPAETQSCSSQRTATDGVTKDVAKSYFKLPTTKFGWTETTSDLYITLVSIAFRVNGAEVKCDVAGTDLAASYTSWFNSTSQDAIVPANSTVTLDCPIICGGISTSGAFTSTATVKIYGFSQERSTDGTGEQKPVTSQGTFQVGSPF